MSIVVSFSGYTPAPRYDGNAWATATIEEASASTGPWTVIDTITLNPPDSDPTEPATRSFTTENGTADSLWYRITFYDADGDSSQTTVPVQNVQFDAFASTAELFRILKIRTPSADQRNAAERVLAAAAGEIRSEIDLADATTLDGWEYDLCAQVNLDRAADLWRHTESIPGVTGLLGDDGSVPVPGRYSWERYAQRLAPLKDQFGLA